MRKRIRNEIKWDRKRSGDNRRRGPRPARRAKASVKGCWGSSDERSRIGKGHFLRTASRKGKRQARREKKKRPKIKDQKKSEASSKWGRK